MKKLIVLCLVFCQYTYAQNIISSSAYSFPHGGYLESTIATASIGTPAGAQWTKMKLRPKFRKINGKKPSIKIHYYKPNQSCGKKAYEARLVFLLVGLGGEAKGGQANHFAKTVADNCLHVAIIPSIFTKDFVEAVSTRGVIGDFRNDVVDYYDFMLYARDFIQKSQNVKFQSYSVFGFSLGGLTTAFISELDSRRKDFNFRTSLIINTPVDLLYGMNVLDGYAAKESEIGTFRMYKILAYWAKNIIAYRRVKTSVESCNGFVANMLWLRENEKQLVVGKALMGNLSQVILTTQNTLKALHGHELGVLTPGPSKRMSKEQKKRLKRIRKREAKKYGFVGYMQNFVIRYLKEEVGESDITSESLNYRNSLISIEDHLRNNQNIYMMHNADDFLLRKDDPDYMARVFGDRFTLYPRGGHVGNLWFKDNADKMIEILKSN